MNYTKVTPQILEQFKNIVGNEFVFVDIETLEINASDETEDHKFIPEKKMSEY